MALATKSKPKGAHHRKRQAQHHKRSRIYHKPYLPYLPMLLIVAVGVVINGFWSNVGVLGAKSDYSLTSLLTETNQQRATESKPTLTLDSRLTAAAQSKAEDMVKQDYWSHNSPSGATPWTFIGGSGYQYQMAGENLAYGFDDASSVVRGWMNSPEHRANLLGTNYSNVGFGIASTPNFQGRGPQTIVVAEYATPLTPGAAPAQAETPVAFDSRPVSRVEVLTGGQATWALLAIAALAGGAFAIFITRHTYRFHKVIVRGERFIAHHPLLDIVIVSVFTAGALLTRTTGVIG